MISDPARPWCAILFTSLLLSTGLSQAALVSGIGQNFTGSTVGTDSFAYPPDSDGAVGPDHFVELINGRFSVYTKTNGVRIQTMTDTDFWAAAGVTLSNGWTVSDPRVVFDPASQRWFASQIDFDPAADPPEAEPNNFLIAVSTNADPTGGWQGFSFPADPTNNYFADFPTLGIDSNAVYLAANMFDATENGVGVTLVSIPKADLVASPPVITNRTLYGVMDYADRGAVLQPAVCLDNSVTGVVLAAGSLGYDFMEHSNLVASVVLNADSTNATLAAATNILVDPYIIPFDAGQPDGSYKIADNDARLSGMVSAVAGIIYAVHNTEVSNHAAIRWYRINAADQTLLESGTIADTNLDFFFPSIAANTNGTVVIGCNGSGTNTNTFVSCYAFVGETVDGVTTFGPPLLLQAGVANYHDPYEFFVGDSRWGDYSATSVDPSDPTRFWTIQMYPSAPNVWSTQISEILTAQSLLTIAPSGTNVFLSWPSFAGQLQSTTNLVDTNAWVDVPDVPGTNDYVASLWLPAIYDQEFFRLVKTNSP